MAEPVYYIAPAVKDDWEDAMEVCWKTFKEFEACEYSEEGVEHFLNFISSNELYQMFLAGEYIMLVAKDSTTNKIIGVVTLRGGNHISLLFVDKKYHKMGIGKALLRELQKSLRNTIILTVNAAPYAIGFYHNVGFMDTKEEQLADGIRYTPMTLFTRIE